MRSWGKPVMRSSSMTYANELVTRCNDLIARQVLLISHMSIATRSHTHIPAPGSTAASHRFQRLAGKRRHEKIPPKQIIGLHFPLWSHGIRVTPKAKRDYPDKTHWLICCKKSQLHQMSFIRACVLLPDCVSQTTCKVRLSCHLLRSNSLDFTLYPPVVHWPGQCTTEGYKVNSEAQANCLTGSLITTIIRPTCIIKPQALMDSVRSNRPKAIMRISWSCSGLVVA